MKLNSKQHITKSGLLKKNPSKVDYSEAIWKMDKFLPEDNDIQEEFNDILSSDNEKEKVEQLTNFFENYMDEEAFKNYVPKGTIKGFAKYFIDVN